MSGDERLRAGDPARPAAGEGAGRRERPRVRVMVVDDHPMWREAVARDLAEAEYDVVATTGEGRQALRVAAAVRPDVVVLDLRLPDLPGVEVARGSARPPSRRACSSCRPAPRRRTSWKRSRRALPDIS